MHNKGSEFIKGTWDKALSIGDVAIYTVLDHVPEVVDKTVDHIVLGASHLIERTFDYTNDALHKRKYDDQ